MSIDSETYPYANDNNVTGMFTLAEIIAEVRKNAIRDWHVVRVDGVYCDFFDVPQFVQALNAGRAAIPKLAIPKPATPAAIPKSSIPVASHRVQNIDMRRASNDELDHYVRSASRYGARHDMFKRATDEEIEKELAISVTKHVDDTALRGHVASAEMERRARLKPKPATPAAIPKSATPVAAPQQVIAVKPRQIQNPLKLKFIAGKSKDITLPPVTATTAETNNIFAIQAGEDFAGWNGQQAVLLDGMGGHYGSALWAKALGLAFLREPSANVAKAIMQATKNSWEKLIPTLDENTKKKLFNRAPCATLSSLAFECFEGVPRVELTQLGDSPILVRPLTGRSKQLHITRGGGRTQLPYLLLPNIVKEGLTNYTRGFMDLENLSEHARLNNSIGLTHMTQMGLAGDVAMRFYVMSDGPGTWVEYMLKQGAPIENVFMELDQLVGANEMSARVFLEWCTNHMTAGRMKVDDHSLMILDYVPDAG